MKSFILPTKDKLMATCKYCDKKGEEPFLAQQVINHVHTKVHLENTPENERETKLKMLQDSINEGKQRLKTSNPAWKNKSKNQKSEEESKEYLEFISYCLSERLSFLQISKIGTFLKQMISRIEGSKLNFFSTHSFNKDIISNITTNCFGKYLVDKIFADISSNRYSISIDTCTVAGENICAIKARYAKNQLDQNSTQSINQIHDKIISIKKLHESSDAHTLMRIVEEKVFNNNEKKLVHNLIGMASDRGSPLVGIDNGLFRLLENSLPQKILHVPDPCHSFNLIIRHSLELLSPDIREFISDIHSYFCSPQRRERLKQVQRENQLKVLCPKKFVKTRWLSLGESLERLIEIWPSLILYMNTMTEKKGVFISKFLKEKRNDDNELTTVNYEKIANLLNNELFQLEIRFLYLIIKSINIANQRFQSKALEISCLKYYINECYASILSFAVKSESLNFQDLQKYTKINWINQENHIIWFFENPKMIQNLLQIQPLFLARLTILTQDQQDQFCSLFKPYLARILDLMHIYLPLDNELINSLDFGQTFFNFGEFLEKILKFNSYFDIIGKEEIPDLILEIKSLTSRNTSWYTENTKSLLEIWANIEKDESFGIKFKLLPQIFRAAQSLPITSSNIERAFSGIKLIKTLIRNKLSEDRLLSICMIIEEYQDSGKFPICKNLLELYEDFKMKFGKRKIDEMSPKEDESQKMDNPEEEEQKQVKENLQSRGIDEPRTMEEEIPIWDDCEEKKHRKITRKENEVKPLLKKGS